MNRRRLKPLVLPLALLVAGAATAGLAEATARSSATLTLYGTVRIVSDLVLLIGAVGLALALFAILVRRGRPPHRGGRRGPRSAG